MCGLIRSNALLGTGFRGLGKRDGMQTFAHTARFLCGLNTVLRINSQIA